MQLPDSFSSDHSLTYIEDRHLKPQFIIFFSLYNSWRRKFLPFPSLQHQTNGWEPPLNLWTQEQKLRPCFFFFFFINKQTQFCLSSLYTGAGLTTVNRARSRRPWFHLTTGSQRIPLHEIFFSCWIWSICEPVISADHSLAKMCLPLPSVHMCLRCGGRQKLWLTAAMSSILAATQTTGRLRTHLSHLYREISGSTHKGRGGLIVLGVIHLLFQGFLCRCLM